MKTNKFLSILVLHVFVLGASISFCSCAYDDDDDIYGGISKAPKGVEAVDLGLSVRWANMNIGASNPRDYGSYFAWGDIHTNSDYKTWNSYRLCNGSRDSMTKYCTQSNYGKVDNKTTLELANDVAHVRWGGFWRMPTAAELNELITKCTWTVDDHRVKVIGPNGNSIFLPCAYLRGYSHSGVPSEGFYWSSSLNASKPYLAHYLFFYYNGGIHAWMGGEESDYVSRHFGLPVRAVCPRTSYPSHPNDLLNENNTTTF